MAAATASTAPLTTTSVSGRAGIDPAAFEQLISSVTGELDAIVGKARRSRMTTSEAAHLASVAATIIENDFSMSSLSPAQTQELFNQGTAREGALWDTLLSRLSGPRLDALIWKLGGKSGEIRCPAGIGGSNANVDRVLGVGFASLSVHGL